MAAVAYLQKPGPQVDVTFAARGRRFRQRFALGDTVRNASAALNKAFAEDLTVVDVEVIDVARERYERARRAYRDAKGRVSAAERRAQRECSFYDRIDAEAALETATEKLGPDLAELLSEPQWDRLEHLFGQAIDDAALVNARLRYVDDRRERAGYDLRLAASLREPHRVVRCQLLRALRREVCAATGFAS
jgi:hypothetical protein